MKPGFTPEDEDDRDQEADFIDDVSAAIVAGIIVLALLVGLGCGIWWWCSKD